MNEDDDELAAVERRLYRERYRREWWPFIALLVGLALGLMLVYWL
jgi:hypothetical protein